MNDNSGFFSLIILSLFLLFWEIICLIFAIPVFILPAPSSVFSAGLANFAFLFSNAMVTLTEIILGILFSVLVSIPVATIMFLCPMIESSLSPLLIASQAIPVFALAPLLVIWFGYGMTGKIIMASIIIFFPITVNILEGLKSCEKDFIFLFRTMGAGPIKMVLYLYWPWALPGFFTGLKIGVSVATIGAVIGEWVGAQKGLGALMIQANARLEVDLLFASIFFLTLMGLCLWKAACFMEKKVIKWQ